MKDALGHGSNAHGAGVASIGVQWTKNKKANLVLAQRAAEAQGHKSEVYPSVNKHAAAWFVEGRGVVINSNSKFWKDPAGGMARATNLSSNDPMHVIHHEIGHALYDPPDNFMTLAHQDMARERVSKYAAMNPKEFVSEVHAGMKAGKSYPEHVMTAFRQYARPRK